MSKTTYGDWTRRVDRDLGNAIVTTTEWLDMDLVLKRFVDATHERGDASLRDRLDYALNGDDD